MLCFTANLATPAEVLVHYFIRFFRICFAFRKCLMTFTRALLQVLLWYFSPGRMSLHAALSFFSFWFRSLCFGASNEFIFLRDCFVWLVQTLGFGCFCDEFSFSFVLRLPI